MMLFDLTIADAAAAPAAGFFGAGTDAGAWTAVAALNPRLNAFITVDTGAGAGAGGCGGCGAGGGTAGPLAGDSAGDQGFVLHRRRAHHGGQQDPQPFRAAL
jgi:aspartyl-tRNA(Asn)/glutamyl-tRNA(Gln) amidotransferase subunit A